MMRVNSPGSEPGGGGAAARGGGGAAGVAGSCAKRWMSRVTPPGSSAGLGGAYDGRGSGRYGAGSGARGADVPVPDPESEERIPVTLGEDAGDGEDFSAGWKNGSFFQESSMGGAAGDGAGAGGGGGAAARDGLLKNCVKLPSVDTAGGGGGAGAGGACAGAGGRWALLKNCVKPPSAESEAPGDEKPFERDGPDEGGAGRGVSSGGRAGDVYDGVTPETKTRVNSPWLASAAGGCGPFTTCVATCGCSFAGGGAAGRCPPELNICVNSPGAAPAPAPGFETGLEAGKGVYAGRSAALADLAGSDGTASEGFAFDSCSNARRNMPVALSGSGCSDPELELLFVMEGGPVPAGAQRSHGRIPVHGDLGLPPHLLWGPWGAHCEAYTYANPP